MIPRIRFETEDASRQWIADMVMRNFKGLQVIEKDKGSAIAKITVENEDLSLLDTNAILTLVDVFIQWGTERAVTSKRKFTLHKVEGGRSLTLTFMGGEYRYSEKPRKRLWTDDYTTIVSKVSQEMGFVPVEIDSRLKEVKHDGVMQYESNPEFLARLARKFGCSWWVDSRGLHFMPREVGKFPKYLLLFKGSLQFTDPDDFVQPISATQLVAIGDPEVKIEYSRRVPRKMKSKGKSGKSGSSGGHLASSFNPDAVGNVETFASKAGGSRSSDEVVNDGSDRMHAEGGDTGSRHERTVYRPDPGVVRFSNATFDKIEVSVTIEGQPTIKVGEVIEVQGIGAMLEGKYYVKEITHTIDSKGFVQKLKLSRDSVKQGKRGSRSHRAGPHNTASIQSQTKGNVKKDEFLNNMKMVAELTGTAAVARRTVAAGRWVDRMTGGILGNAVKAGANTVIQNIQNKINDSEGEEG